MVYLLNNNNTIPSVIHQVGSGEGVVFTALTLYLMKLESFFFERPSAQLSSKAYKKQYEKEM